MIAELWFDLIALAMLGSLCFAFYKVETSTIGIELTPESDGNLPEEKKPRFSIYPSKLIRQAGIRPQRIRGLYWGTKAFFAVLVPLLVLEAGNEALHWGAAIVAGLGAFFVTDIWLLARRRGRKAEITDSLSFFISLMVVYLQSGMTLGQAFQQAAKTGLTKKNSLAREVGLISREIESGRDRLSAFTALAERTGVDELNRLAAVISVGFRVGSPVRDTLGAQAELLKAKQSQMADDLVNRKTMEAMIPMLLVCFPMFIVLVFFPAAKQVFDVLGMMQELF